MLTQDSLEGILLAGNSAYVLEALSTHFVYKALYSYLTISMQFL